jgi:O-acetyl-ADP-ribose deacetylase (regulator of RNase III)
VIRVVVDDLAFFHADAVVRPADEMLAPLTPAMSRLDHQAGERFASLRRVSSPLDAGAAVVTGAGELAAPFVLHVVLRDQHSPVDRGTVRRALVAAWQRAADWGLATVAAPLVGAGAGGLPIEESVELLIETFQARTSPSCPAGLTLVVERDDERELVEAIVNRRIG